MTPASSDFECPNCGLLTTNTAAQTGRGARCSACGAAWPAPEPEIAAGSPAATPSERGNAQARPARQLLVVGVASLLGTAVGWWVLGASPLILIGSLLGFLTGRTIFGMTVEGADDRSGPAWFPNAYVAVALSVGGWLLAFGLWLLHANGMLRGEGASLLFFLFLPLVGVCGLIGGPTASALARRASRQVELGQRPEGDRRWARLALVLSRAMTVAVLGFLFYMLARLFG